VFVVVVVVVASPSVSSSTTPTPGSSPSTPGGTTSGRCIWSTRGTASPRWASPAGFRGDGAVRSGVLADCRLSAAQQLEVSSVQHDQRHRRPDVAPLHEPGEHAALLQPGRLPVSPASNSPPPPPPPPHRSSWSRSLELVYQRDGVMKGIPLFRFVAPTTMFANGLDYPPNEGFCPCRQSGLLNVSSCRHSESVTG